MLTPKENFLETIHGGHPDRFVNQFDFYPMPYSDPFNATNPFPYEVGTESVDLWGVSWSWPEGTPGPFPVHGPGKTVIEDIESWREHFHTPPLEYADSLWAEAETDYASYDRSEVMVGPCMFPGLYECTHNLMGIENALVSFYTHPDEMHELINAIVDWEMAYVEQLGKHLHPDIVFHHDDWGSSQSTFLSVEMFRDFYLEPYKKLYQCYRDNGFEVIVHHSDSFAATYVPMMIDMGIDCWQGGTLLNDIPALVKQYGGKISFMTGIDNQILERPDWNYDDILATVRKICTDCGKLYFCPCQTQGGNESSYPGFYEAVSRAIDQVSREMF